MNFKEELMRMSLWKVVLSVFLIIILVSFVFEEILSHTIFKVIDRTLVTMEQEASDDRADINEMDKHEQNEYCEKYETVKKEKANLAKRDPKEFTYRFDFNTMEGHEIEVNVAAKNHLFNPAHCEKEIL